MCQCSGTEGGGKPRGAGVAVAVAARSHLLAAGHLLRLAVEPLRLRLAPHSHAQVAMSKHQQAHVAAPLAPGTSAARNKRLAPRTHAEMGMPEHQRTHVGAPLAPGMSAAQRMRLLHRAPHTRVQAGISKHQWTHVAAPLAPQVSAAQLRVLALASRVGPVTSRFPMALVERTHACVPIAAH